MELEKKSNSKTTEIPDNKEVSTVTLETLQQLIAERPDDSELYFARAELFFQRNDLGKAINDYNQVLKIVPHNQEAKGKVEFIKTILKYQNTDIYANPNTDMDPWLE